MEYKCPAGAIPCTICSICTSFQDALAIKVSLDLLKGLWSYGGFNLTGSGYPQIYSALRGETMRQTPDVLQVQERARGPQSPYQVCCVSDFTRRRGGEKMLSFFVCPSCFLSVTLCLSVTLLNVRVCSPDFAMKALENRNDFDAVG